MNITPEMMSAWETLQSFAKTVPRYVNATALERSVADAIDVLDDSDFMAPIDEAVNEREMAAQFAADSPNDSTIRPCRCGGSLNGEVGGIGCAETDPAEWGDTTREDMARHQGTAP